MILAVVAMALGQADATEFFPTPLGAKWRYIASSSSLSVNRTDEVTAPVTLADELPAVCVRTLSNGKVTGTTLFRVDGNTVYLMGYTKSRLFDTPRIVFRVGEKKQTWDWKGMEEGLDLSIKGESELGGVKEILGVKRNTLKVVVTAELGQEPLVWKIKQEALYAAGVGLVEMSDERSTKKTRDKSVTRLESFTFPEDSKR